MLQLVRRRRVRASRPALSTYVFPALLLLFVGTLVIFGGSSRYDQIAQVPVRLVALLVIAAATLRSITAPSSLRWPAVLLGGAIALVSLQLLPLPPSIWQNLPGRTVFIEAAAAAGFEQPWRPIAIAPDMALNTLLSLTVPCATLYGLAVLKPHERSMIVPVLLTVVALATLMGVYQLATGNDGSAVVFDRRFRGTASGIFANRNHQAVLLAIGLPLLAGWAAARDERARAAAVQGGAIAAGILVLIVLLATGSRAGVVLGGVGLIGALALMGTQRRRTGSVARPRRLTIWSVAGVSMAALLGITIWLGRGQSFERLVSVDPLADKRASALPTVMEMTISYFPVGSGFGSFDAAFRHAEPLELLDTRYFNQAHNDLIQVVLEGGILGLALLLGLALWLGWAGLMLWRSNSRHRDVAQGKAASIGAVILLAASVVDYPLRTPMIMAVGSVLIFMIATAVHEVRSARGVPD